MKEMIARHNILRYNNITINRLTCSVEIKTGCFNSSSVDGVFRMIHRRIKILLVQTMNMNLGDSVLADNDEFLLRKTLRFRDCDILRYSISSEDVGQLRYADAMIFAGGILKTSNERFWHYIPALINEAEKWGVPVYLSAIGVEPVDPQDERGLALKQALNLSCVKGISVRDDVETLRREYIENPDIRIDEVTDPAVWCAQTYKSCLEQRQKAEKTVPEIGVGIVRERLFADYGHPEISREFQIQFWLDVLSELEKRGFGWTVFTNGDRHDELFAEEIVRLAGRGKKLRAPRDAEELVEYIAGFDGVIAGRMHSNIVAYSLGIPSVGFVWNRKLRFWSERIRHPERFFNVEDMNAAAMVDVLSQVLGRRERVPQRLKRPVMKAMRSFVRRFCRARETETLDVSWEKCLVAPGLGGIELRYPETNTLEALHYSLAHGFRNFQLDLRLTSDGVPVCVDRWNKDTYKKLNLLRQGQSESSSYPALSSESFSQACYFHRFPTLRFEDFLNCEEVTAGNVECLILAIGRPKPAVRQELLDVIVKACEGKRLPVERLLLRLERPEDVRATSERLPGLKIQYYFVHKDGKDWLEECREGLAFCAEKGITQAAMHVDHYTDETAALFSAAQMQVCVYGAVRTERIIDALQRGAAFASSRYYDVDYLRRLTGA